MTDETSPASGPAAGSDAQSAPTHSEAGAPTPEELLAETLADDAEVGSDGTGMGELP